MQEHVQLALNFKDLAKKYGWVAATTFMFGMLVYKIKKEDQKNKKLHDDNEDNNENIQSHSESEIEDQYNDNDDGQAKRNNFINNNNNSIMNQSTEDNPQSTQLYQQKLKKLNKMNSNQTLSKKYNDMSSQSLISEEDMESKIMSLKKPTNKNEVLKHSRSQMQYNFLKKSRAQHFDEEDQNNHNFSDIDKRQTHFLKNKFSGEIKRIRQFASDQDDDTINQYQKNQLKRIIKDQEDQQDQLFFKIYGEFIIDEKNNEDESD